MKPSPDTCQSRGSFDMLPALTRWNRLVFITLAISMQITALVSNDVEPLLVQSGLLNDTLTESDNISIVRLIELYDPQTNSTDISDNEAFDTSVESIGLNVTSSSTTKSTATTTTTRKATTKTTTTTEPTTSTTATTTNTTTTTTTATTKQIYEITSTRPKKKPTTLYIKKTTESINSTETFINHKLYPNTRNIQNDSFISTIIEDQTTATNSTVFSLNLSRFYQSLFDILDNFIVYYMILLAFIILLVIFLFITSGTYIFFSKKYLRNMKLRSAMSKRKNMSFDVIDDYKLTRNTDHIINRIDSNYFPIIIDQDDKRRSHENTDGSNENMYELPYTLDSTISLNNTNSDNMNLRTFTCDQENKNSYRKTTTNMGDESGHGKGFGFLSFNNYKPNLYNTTAVDNEVEDDVTFLDERYKHFSHKDEIYFRSKQAQIFNPALISQCLEYESTSDLNDTMRSKKSKIYGFSGI